MLVDVSVKAPPPVAAGDTSFPFTIKVPTEFKHTNGQTIPAPPTFVQPGFPWGLAYDLEVNLRKKGMFSSDSEYVKRTLWANRTLR